MKIFFPKKWPDDLAHWLNDKKYTWFHKGYDYAATITRAIPVLAQCELTDLYYTVWSIMRGVNRWRQPEIDKLKKAFILHYIPHLEYKLPNGTWVRELRRDMLKDLEELVTRATSSIG